MTQIASGPQGSGAPPGSVPGAVFDNGSSRRPSIGTAAAAKAVAEDASNLVRAELELAKAEVMEGVRAKGLGAGLFAAAGALAAVAGLGLLITIGLALALIMPGWAAALVVSVALLLIAAVLALVGRSKIATPVRIETTRQNVEEDVAWTKAHLRR
jgi:hypothetical protein